MRAVDNSWKATAIAVVLLGIAVGISESEILTNEEATEYGVNGVIVNPKLQRLSLRCNYTGDKYSSSNDQTYTYQWLKDDQVLEEGAKYRIRTTGAASVLIIEGCNSEDAGNYTCKLNGEEHATLQVFMYPTLENVEKSKNQVQGDPLTLTCKASGHPKPVISWFKDNESLTLDPERMTLEAIDGVENAKLVIQNLQYEDKGKYMCSAKSNNVTREVEIMVRVKDKYAALWPFLGICAEVAILCTIIFIYEKRRSKPDFEDEDDKKEASSHRK